MISRVGILDGVKLLRDVITALCITCAHTFSHVSRIYVSIITHLAHNPQISNKQHFNKSLSKKARISPATECMQQSFSRHRFAKSASIHRSFDHGKILPIFLLRSSISIDLSFNSYLSDSFFQPHQQKEVVKKMSHFLPLIFISIWTWKNWGIANEPEILVQPSNSAHSFHGNPFHGLCSTSGMSQHHQASFP